VGSSVKQLYREALKSVTGWPWWWRDIVGVGELYVGRGVVVGVARLRSTRRCAGATLVLLLVGQCRHAEKSVSYPCSLGK
jgi:hypothetical protein